MTKTTYFEFYPTLVLFFGIYEVCWLQVVQPGHSPPDMYKQYRDFQKEAESQSEVRDTVCFY